MKIKSLISLIIYFSLYSLLSAQIGVMPMTIDKTLEHGKSYQLSLLVRNTSERPKAFRISCADRIYDNFGSPQEVKPGTNPRSCIEWLDFPTGIINIGPKESKKIVFKAEVPDSAHGTYWANLYVGETTPSRKIKTNELGMHINVLWRTQVSINFTVHSERETSAEIRHMEIKQESSGKHCLEIEIMNTCLEKIMCRGYCEIRDQYGNTLEKINLYNEGKFSIYPSYSRIVVSKPFLTEFKDGIYPCIAVVDFGGENLIAGQIILKIEEK